MPHLSPIAPKRLMKLLEREGFVCIRIKGSHHFFIHEVDKRTTNVPVHGGRDIGVGLLRQILKDLNWSADEFHKRLHR